MIDQQHADEADLAQGETAEPLQHRLRPGNLAETDLNDVGPRCRHAQNCIRARLHIITGIADRRAHRHVAWHAGADRRDGRGRQRAQRAGGGVLRVDNVGAERGDEARLALIHHAGKHSRRRAHVFHQSC
ncbi:MAG: hypothetical protein M5U16_09835 [Hyphomicrobium sp.]|nr:hypothetical protein [Hyphomicrobium sp.]